MKKDVLFLLRRLHGQMHEWRMHVWPVLKQRLNNPKAVFLILTPEHDNLGDQALALSEVELLKKLEIEYIELTDTKLNVLRSLGWLRVMNGKTIIFNGGGYLGTLWFNSEQLVREVLRENPRSTICMLPNTIYYEDTPFGNQEKERSVRLYAAHKKLHLYARENVSYEQMSQLYRSVKLVPDMVLSMDESSDQKERCGCLLCLRSDREKTLTDAEQKTIQQEMEGIFVRDVTYTDMLAGHTILPEQREYELKKKFDQFKRAELVITDRLHGMIFCAITATPCIVLDSKSPKLKGCYEWVCNLDYIRFAESPNQIGQIYMQMSKEKRKYDNTHLRHYYAELEADLLRFARKKT